MSKKLKAFLKIDRLAVVFFASFAVASAATLFPHVIDQTDFAAEAFIRSGSLVDAALYFFGTFAVLFLLGTLLGPVIPAAVLLGGVFVYSALLMLGAYSVPLYCVCGLLCVLCCAVLYAYLKRSVSEKAARRIGIAVAVFFGTVYLVIVGLISLFRIWSYTSVCFDFGIFCQMFNSMLRDFSQSVSCERNEMLQHFAVHISPVYYLFLPFYAICPKPETLAVLQVLITLASVVPLWLLAKKKGLRGAVPGILCAVLLLFPPFVGGSLYDLHENCFLTFFLLFLFWFYEKRSIAGTLIFTVLVCSVKEDAPVYIFFFALYALIEAFRREDRKERVRCRLIAVLCLVLSVLWFIVDYWILDSYGLGIMANRFSNLTGGEDSLVQVVLTALRNPTVLLQAIVNDPTKLEYAVCLFVPLAVLPFRTKKFERLILLCPALLYHFLSDYAYQHQIYYQYAFGSAAFLLFAVVLNLADLPHEKQAKHAFPALLLAALLFLGTITPKLSYIGKYTDRSDSFAQVSELLDTVPDDASVCASTCLCIRLSDREVLYNIDRNGYPTDTDYVVLDLRYTNGKTLYTQYTISPDWEKVAFLPQYLAIFRAK